VLAAIARGAQLLVAPETQPAPGARFTVAGCAGRLAGEPAAAGREAA